MPCREFVRPDGNDREALERLPVFLPSPEFTLELVRKDIDVVFGVLKPVERQRLSGTGVALRLNRRTRACLLPCLLEPPTASRS